MIAGLGADYIIDTSKKYALITREVTVLLVVLISVPVLIPFAAGMPNMTNYYSEMIGGTKGAYMLGFEMDYWGESYLDLIPWLNNNLEEGARVYIPMAWNIFNTYKYGDIGQIGKKNSSFGISSLGLDSMLTQKGILRKDIQIITNKNEDSDYYVLLNRRSIIESQSKGIFDAAEMRKYIKECKPLYSVKVGDVPVSMIFKRDCIGK